MKICERIQRSRRTDREISKAVGTSDSVVWHWRRGLTHPHIRFITALAEVIGCDPVDLIPPKEAQAA
jgi:transcriptional regulator with XRE-family HTH domain